MSDEPANATSGSSGSRGGSGGSPLVFRSNGSMLSGLIGLAVIGVLVPFAVSADSRFPDWGVPLLLFLATLGWMVLVRPRIRVGSEELELRGPLETVTIPLAAVGAVEVRQALTVQVGEQRYVNVAVGRTRRQTAKETSGIAWEGKPALSFGGMVEQRLERRVDDARTRHGVTVGSPEQAALAQQVRRQRARVEIALLLVTGVATLVLAL